MTHLPAFVTEANFAATTAKMNQAEVGNIKPAECNHNIWLATKLLKQISS